MLIWLISLFISPAAADWDLSLAIFGRTRPVATVQDINGGYGHAFWGEGGDPQNPWFGYVRTFATARLSTSPTGIIGFDFYPISFLGMSVGRLYSRRYVDQPEVDCEQLECRGWLNNTFLQVKTVGQFKSLFWSISFDKTDYDKLKSLSRPVFQAVNGVVQNPLGDRGDDWFGSVGYELNDRWAIGVSVQEFETSQSRNRQDMHLLFVRMKYDQWICNAGVGRFYSSPLGTAPQLIGTCTWNQWPKIGY